MQSSNYYSFIHLVSSNEFEIRKKKLVQIYVDKFTYLNLI